MTMKKTLVIAGVALLSLAFTGTAIAAGCPEATVAKSKRLKAGAYPQQYELAAFEQAGKCKLTFQENPDIAKLNGRIRGNPSALPSVAQRLPEEPLVVLPYKSIGKYGGTLDALSNATEAGTSDFLSIRHVNLVRYSDDLQTIVPNVAKGWEWNSSFTELTFFLRKGHKWSDGEPFTAADVKFWYDNLALDKRVIEKSKDYVLTPDSKRFKVTVIDPQTVRFTLPSPKPGLLNHFATSFAQGFQPKHFLGKYHPSINPKANQLARKAGFKNGLEVIKAYFGNSDWTDTPSPLLSTPKKVTQLPKDVVPTLESHITIKDTTEGRHYVANPYFFMVDTAGNQLPYINEMDELYINDNEVRILKLVNGEVHYKTQSLNLESVPILLENRRKGKYQIDVRPKIGLLVFSFNVTSEDPQKRKIFGNREFRRAMSIAINRDELNEVVFLGEGVPRQYTGFSPLPNGADKGLESYAIEFNPKEAKKILDSVGLVDKDGDGFRDLPNGQRITLNLQFATQSGAGAKLVELVGQHWADVGVKTSVKEVTPDEYRGSQSSNKLDVGIWEKGQPSDIIIGNNELFVPPFENYFGHRTGLLWSEYIDSKGKNGVKPPAFVDELIADITAFQALETGTSKSNALAAKLAKDMTENLLFIGTVLGGEPIYHHKSLQNFVEFKTASYEYYRTFPYRGHQWWIKG